MRKVQIRQWFNYELLESELYKDITEDTKENERGKKQEKKQQ